jgi:hypothetical protein
MMAGSNGRTKNTKGAKIPWINVAQTSSNLGAKKANMGISKQLFIIYCTGAAVSCCSPAALYYN